MSLIPLRQCTVADARDYYRSRIPIKYIAPQTSDEKVLFINSYDELEYSFIPNGNLKYMYNDEFGIIRHWLDENIDGPYYTPDPSTIFYFLEGYHSIMGHYDMQICSDPINVLSDDCLDSTHVWIPI